MDIKTDSDVIKVLSTFAQYGFRKTSMANLGDAFGVSRQALYKRFGNKQLIFEWLIAEINAQALADVKSALADKSIPMIDRLVRAFDRWTGRYIDILGRSPHAAEIMDFGIIVARNKKENGSMIAEKIRMLMARELVIDGFVGNLAQAERFVFVMYMGSKGLTLTAVDRSDYLEKIRLIVQTLFEKRE